MAEDNDFLDLTALDSDDGGEDREKATPREDSEVPPGGSRPTPQKYRKSDTHRETMELLSNISPAAVKIPSIREVRDALEELLREAEVADLEDIDSIQKDLEERLDADLEIRRDLIESVVQAHLDANRTKREDDASQDASQADTELGASQASEDQAAGKKRRRTGGKAGFAASLPLMLPKMAGGKTKSIIVQVDDERQHLEGDSGAVGRIHNDGKELILDIKGHEYKGHMVRSSALLLVSMGDEEAKVEEVIENLCILTHHQDLFQHLGGKVLKGANPGHKAAGSDDSDYHSGPEEKTGSSKKQKVAAGGRVGSVTKKRKTPSKATKPRAQAAKKGGGGSAKKKGGTGKGASKPSRKSVSLGELKKKAQKKDDDDDDGDDDEEEEEQSEPDDDDSDFSG